MAEPGAHGRPWATHRETHGAILHCRAESEPPAMRSAQAGAGGRSPHPASRARSGHRAHPPAGGGASGAGPRADLARQPDAGTRPRGIADGRPADEAPAHGGSVLVVSADVARLEQAFVEQVGAAKRADPAAAVLVVVGSHLQHIYLRRLLARSLTAVANVRFVTLMDLAGELAPASEPERRTGERFRLPLPDGAHIPLLEQVMAEHRSRAGGDRAYGLADAGMVHAVAATIRDLREGAIAARLVGTASPRPWLRTLATMAAASQAALTPFVDATRRVADAAAGTPAHAAAAVQHAAPGAGQVLVYGIYDVNALQLGMLDLLARTLPTLLFLPWHARAEPFAFAGDTVDRLRKRGLRLLPLDTGVTARERQAARAVFSCADRQAETEETVRRVLEDLAEGVPAGEIAILHRMDPIYDELICGVLDRAAVPRYRSAGQPVRRTVVGRAALNLLLLLYAEPHRGTLLELLSLPGLDLTWIETAPEDTELTPRPARWEALSKELGLVKGWSEFESVLAFHVEHAARGDADERAAESVAAARQLRAVVRTLAAVAEWLPAVDRWETHAEHFLDLLRRFVPAAKETPVWDAIAHRIRTLAVLDPRGHPRRRGCRHPGAVPPGRGDRRSPGDRVGRLLPAQRRIRRQRDERAPGTVPARIPDRLRRTHLPAGDPPGSAAAGCRAGTDQSARPAGQLPAAQGPPARRGAPAVRAGLPGRDRASHPLLPAPRHQFDQRASAVELSVGGGGRPGRRLSVRRNTGAERRRLVPALAGAHRLCR